MSNFRRYIPIIVVVLVSALMSFAAPINFFHGFMGFFFCLLATLKLFNVSGFADGFQMYDIIASRLRIYALIYPFLELSLGLLFLSNLIPLITNGVTLFLMIIGLIGVISSLRRGLNVRCSCMGTTLNVPLSTVTVIENLGMGMMALINIFVLLMRF